MDKFTDSQLKQISELKKIYSIKNVKTFQGMECQGCNATLYKNGKKFVDIIDSGDGGELNFQGWKERDEIEADAKKVGEYESDIVYDNKPLVMKYDAETLVNELIDSFLLEKSYKRKCNKSTVFITNDLKVGEYREVKSPYSDRVKEYIVNKYGNKLVEIINERYL